MLRREKVGCDHPSMWDKILLSPKGMHIQKVIELVLEAAETDLAIEGFTFNDHTFRVRGKTKDQLTDEFFFAVRTAK